MTLWCLTFINHILYVQSTSSVACRIHCLLFGFCEECGVERRGMNACGVILNLFNSIFSKCVLTQVRCKSGFCFFLSKNTYFTQKSQSYQPTPVAMPFTNSLKFVRQFDNLLISLEAEKLEEWKLTWLTFVALKCAAFRQNSINISVVDQHASKITNLLLIISTRQFFIISFILFRQAATLLIVWN